MKNLRFFIMVTVMLLIGGATFYSSRSSAISAQDPLNNADAGWLTTDSPEILELEEAFQQNNSIRVKTLNDCQDILAQAIENMQSSDDNILQASASVSDAHEKLVLDVARHIINLRKKLPVSSQDLFMELCSKTVSGPFRRFIMPGGSCSTANAGNGECSNAAGKNKGFGKQRRQRRRNGLGNPLRLTDKQIQWAATQDPTFQRDLDSLRSEFLTHRGHLCKSFQTEEISDELLYQAIENMIKAHNQLEKRIIEHIIVIRTRLTVDQQKWLIGLCRHR